MKTISQNTLPEIRESRIGELGWAGLGAYVLAWDILAPETLSSAVDRALEHPKMKYVAWGIGGIVTGHLFNIFPEQIDPLQRTADFIGDKISGIKD